MQQAGYVPVASFIFPENCWTQYFYHPQVTVQKEFLKQHAGNRAADVFIADQINEERLYNKYKNFYGYVFYIGKKIQELLSINQAHCQIQKSLKVFVQFLLPCRQNQFAC